MTPLVVAAVLVLFACVWPLPRTGMPPFSLHMVQHMVVVAMVAPLIALGVAGSRVDPARIAPRIVSPIPASMVEMVAVWTWHAPALHHWARHSTTAFALEQATFLCAGVALWSSALGGSAELRQRRVFASIAGLLLTFMHMTLLGALLALTARDLYGHGGHESLSPVVDQQLGGAIMIVMSAFAYLAGVLGLVAHAWLRRSRAA